MSIEIARRIQCLGQHTQYTALYVGSGSQSQGEGEARTSYVLDSLIIPYG